MGIIVKKNLQFVIQVDLVSDDIMLLDIWDCILVWIGEGANKQEKDAVEQLAFVSTKLCTC